MSSLSLTTLTVVTPMVLAICITAWPTALLAPFCRTQSPGLRLTKSFNILQRTKLEVYSSSKQHPHLYAVQGLISIVAAPRTGISLLTLIQS